MKNTFFFDLHPPFGKLLIGAAAYVAGFNGIYLYLSNNTLHEVTLSVRVNLVVILGMFRIFFFFSTK